MSTKNLRKKVKILLTGISPAVATKLIYRYNFKRKLNLIAPRDINEKMNYLKLKTYYNNPLVTKCVDKYEVRNYLGENGFGELLPELYGAFNDTNELRKKWSDFPKQFVMKCNHGCDYNILVTDKDQLNLDAACLKLDRWLQEDYWKIFCEPQYKNVVHKIIVEEYLADDILTYKFYCFNGEPKVLYLSSNGEHGEKDLYLDYYDIDMNWLDITLYPHLHSKEKAVKPQNYEAMLQLARKLSKPFPFVRIDLYNVNGKIYFSEFTFIPTGGYMKLEPSSVLDEWGEWLKLPTD